MDVKELNPGHVVARIARYRFVVTLLSHETRGCSGCRKFLHRRTKCIRKTKNNKTLYYLCGDCAEEEIEENDTNESGRKTTLRRITQAEEPEDI